MLNWLNINAASPSVFPYLSVLSLTYSTPVPLFSPPPPSRLILISFTLFFFSFFSARLFCGLPLCFSLLSVPNLNSDLFDLQPAFIPAVQSTPSISNANSAWGGTLPAYIHVFIYFYIYLYIYKNKCTSRDADMRIIRLTQVNLFL